MRCCHVLVVLAAALVAWAPGRVEAGECSIADPIFKHYANLPPFSDTKYIFENIWLLANVRCNPFRSEASFPFAVDIGNCSSEDVTTGENPGKYLYYTYLFSCHQEEGPLADTHKPHRL